MSPARKVSSIEMATSAAPACHGSFAPSEAMSVRCCTTALIGKISTSVSPTPSNPAIRPSISVSALNTRAISCYDAPMARRMPISFVRSSTEIYVIMPIMIDETTSEIETNAIRTYEMALMIVVTERISSAT